MGVANYRKALVQLDGDERVCMAVHTLGGPQQMVLIPAGAAACSPRDEATGTNVCIERRVMKGCSIWWTPFALLLVKGPQQMEKSDLDRSFPI